MLSFKLSRGGSRISTVRKMAWPLAGLFMGVLVLLAVMPFKARAATRAVTINTTDPLGTPSLPYAKSASQLGNSPAWRSSPTVLGLPTFTESLEILTPGANVSLDWLTARTKLITLGQNTTFTFVNTPTVTTNLQRMLVGVIGNGAFTVTFTGAAWQTAQVGTPVATTITYYVFEAANSAVNGFIAGDVVGPASSTDDAIVRFNGATGKLVQNSAATIADTTGSITMGDGTQTTVALGSNLSGATDPSLNFANNSLGVSSGFVALTVSGGSFAATTAGNTVLGSGSSFGWAAGAGINVTSVADTMLVRDGAANTLALRNGVNPQTFNLYNTYTDASNYERLQIYWNGNTARIQTAAAGTGATRALTFGTGGASQWNLTTAGNWVAATDNSVDIGASGATRPRDIYVADDVVAGGDGTFTAALSAATLNLGGTTVTDALSATATLDFPSTLAQTDSDLTITVTGAADGDTVDIGVPNGSTLTGSCYSGWVSAANTVTIRFSVYGVAAKDPASGTFRATVWKF